MTLFDGPIGPETYAAIRFGCGLPQRGAPVTPEAMLARLQGPDEMLRAYPRLTFEEGMALGREIAAVRKEMRSGVEDAATRLKAGRKALNQSILRGLATEVMRNVETDDPLRERLQRFWENHFAARAKIGLMRAGADSYADQAIRPHIAGRFADMLKSAVTHPIMLTYLDQAGSVGPNSPRGQRKGSGLNENLAREVLELHTLGVGAPYTQGDVTQFAELLTGLNASIAKGMTFNPRYAEPGAETLLGVTYGGDDPADLADIHAALDDLARHPSTAAHISRKLAVHFVSDDPDPDLVAAMTAAYRRSDGLLPEVYAAMLSHPASWRDFGAKVKTPMDFVTSALRALDVRAGDLQALSKKANRLRETLLFPLRRMGQPYHQPPGPDGFPENADAWIQPFGLAARIAWALQALQVFVAAPPDPRGFVDAALADAASGRLIWAAGAAETRSDGVAIVLASAEFNRR
jgi:uncharacterized protein (DUF1800 family)